MFLNTVIFVLREVLEATLIFTVLLAVSRMYGIQKRWALWAIMLGIIASYIYGQNLGVITQWYGGVGQELFNAGVLITVNVCLFLTLFLMAQLCRHDAESKTADVSNKKQVTKSTNIGVTQSTENSNHGHAIRFKSALACVSCVAISLAICREGSEIDLYINGFWANRAILPAVFSGTCMGIGIGFSLAALLYFFLTQLNVLYARLSLVILIIMLAVSSAIQSVQLLMQSGLLPSLAVVWDSSNIIDESSTLGLLFTVLFGYEATPTTLEVAAFISVIVCSIFVFIIGLKSDYFLLKSKK